MGYYLPSSNKNGLLSSYNILQKMDDLFIFLLRLLGVSSTHAVALLIVSAKSFCIKSRYIFRSIYPAAL